MPVCGNIKSRDSEDRQFVYVLNTGYLKVTQPRILAITRYLQNGNCTDCEARYDILRTWLKQTLLVDWMGYGPHIRRAKIDGYDGYRIKEHVVRLRLGTRGQLIEPVLRDALVDDGYGALV
ncbi:hypothetical protein DPMN_032107 [Dreissena polymorpha]|uniref:Uncharacterized protein n=1 Tax=Dreissena polymorpha TaxID=45954 RepID=A0A9D4RJQ8_DREPO|nr:hypothetical protein DPMN_032107 [Dreissena polymorpha]